MIENGTTPSTCYYPISENNSVKESNVALFFKDQLNRASLNQRVIISYEFSPEETSSSKKASITAEVGVENLEGFTKPPQEFMRSLCRLRPTIEEEMAYNINHSYSLYSLLERTVCQGNEVKEIHQKTLRDSYYNERWEDISNYQWIGSYQFTELKGEKFPLSQEIQDEVVSLVNRKIEELENKSPEIRLAKQNLH